MPFEFGDIVLVRFPFTNQRAWKQRPAVIVSNKLYNASRPDVVIMAITSQIGTASGIGEMLIANWQRAQLLKPSAIKPVLRRSNRGWFSSGSALYLPRTCYRCAMRS